MRQQPCFTICPQVLGRVSQQALSSWLIARFATQANAGETVENSRKIATRLARRRIPNTV